MNTIRIAQSVCLCASIGSSVSLAMFVQQPTMKQGAITTAASAFLLASAEALKEVARKESPTMKGYVVELALDSMCAGLDAAIAVGLFASVMAGMFRSTVRELLL